VSSCSIVQSIKSFPCYNQDGENITPVNSFQKALLSVKADADRGRSPIKSDESDDKTRRHSTTCNTGSCPRTGPALEPTTISLQLLPRFLPVWSHPSCQPSITNYLSSQRTKSRLNGLNHQPQVVRRNHLSCFRRLRLKIPLHCIKRARSLPPQIWIPILSTPSPLTRHLKRGQ
jgi:hypothetical protein